MNQKTPKTNTLKNPVVSHKEIMNKMRQVDNQVKSIQKMAADQTRFSQVFQPAIKLRDLTNPTRTITQALDWVEKVKPYISPPSQALGAHAVKSTVSALLKPPLKITNAQDLGKLVRTRRKKQKLSQQRFADLTGVGRRFISELENGKATLEFDKVVKVLNAVGIDLFVKER